MKEVEQIVYQRMIADTEATVGLLALLGESVTPPITITRILHSHQVATPPSPGLVYGILSSIKNASPKQIREVFINFAIYSQDYSSIGFRLMRLFDGIQHPLSLISGGASQVGGVSSVFDFEGPDGFDESLQVQKKDMRFRFFATVKAQNPI